MKTEKTKYVQAITDELGAPLSLYLTCPLSNGTKPFCCSERRIR